MNEGAGRSLATHPVHLGLGATASSEPVFPQDERAMAWYADYTARHLADGAEGRLVSQFTFTESWNSWEVHPDGDEVVVCLSGSMTLLQEMEGGTVTTTLEEGDYAINPRGIWHTADVAEEAKALFITAGIGTRHRPR